MTKRPKVLLFDLGGVIVRWVGLEELARMTGQSRDAVVMRFAGSDVFQDYETGQCSDDVFAAELVSLFDLEFPLSEAKALWNSWVQESYDGTKDMLKDLRKDYTLACLSNTNALHWGHLPTHIRVEEFFDHSFASHLIEAAKPDLKSYNILIQEMKVAPADIWFFDDTLINVEAAIQAGMVAHHVDREVGVIPTLKRLGFLQG